MSNNSNIFTGHRGGWTLIVLLIVMAIIAVLMMIYLPRVLESYSPPTTTDPHGKKKPVLENVKDQLAPIDERNKQLENYLPPEGRPEDNQSKDQNQ